MIVIASVSEATEDEMSEEVLRAPRAANPKPVSKGIYNV
jgi:hypothetical protein